MANTAQHNEIIKICFEGNKHLKHVLSMDEINQMTLIENRFPLTKLPVCGVCERLAYWSKGMVAVCKHCGGITKNPVPYSTYLSSGFDVDTTGATAKKAMDKRTEIADLILPDYSDMIERNKGVK